MNENRLKASEAIVQSLSALAIGLLALQTGFVYAWPSYNLANFVSNETVLSAPISTLQVSLLGSLPNLGGFIGMPVCGWIFSTFGRKYGSMLFGVPYLVAWLIISLTNNITLILIAVTIAGTGIAGQNISTMFMSEIAHVSIRGGLTSISSSAYMTGLLLANIMGGQFDYMTMIIINLSVSVLTIMLLSLIRDSPVFLVLVGREEEAAKSIAFYRRLDVNSDQVKAEVDKIRNTMDPKLETLLQEKELGQELDLKTADSLIEKTEVKKKEENISAWRFLLRSKSSKRILVILLTMIAMTILTGGIILQVYTEPLFAEAAPSMSANQCAIFAAINSFISSLVNMVVIDRLGRKAILMVTTASTGICTGLLGLQLQLHFAPNWFTVVLINVYAFMYTAGPATIPFVLASEVFLPEVGSLCNTFCYSFVWPFFFIALSVFPPIVEFLGLGPIFYIFCFMSFAVFLFSLFYLPETKGLAVDKIQMLFLKQQK
ncbi:unnamed protein product [Arctia plantaginis]|uniref:Major facilitator superfamily (MFS) profile domain-containing protein n=1 Tax=Arctia plantaginis TaxID=874455 RepID=A0A8S1ADZ0_ARCPL|nr:unnamed protein product [Arctia plantaginis]